MPRTLTASDLDDNLASFQAEVRRLALALVEQVMTAEIERMRSLMPLFGGGAGVKPRPSAR